MLCDYKNLAFRRPTLFGITLHDLTLLSILLKISDFPIESAVVFPLK